MGKSAGRLILAGHLAEVVSKQASEVLRISALPRASALLSDLRELFRILLRKSFCLRPLMASEYPSTKGGIVTEALNVDHLRQNMERIYRDWDKALSENDAEGLLQLYAKDAVIESPLIPHLMAKRKASAGVISRCGHSLKRWRSGNRAFGNTTGQDI